MENLKFIFAKWYANNTTMAIVVFMGVMVMLMAVLNVLHALSSDGSIVPIINIVIWSFMGGFVEGIVLACLLDMVCGEYIEDYYYSKIKKNNK